MTDDDLQRLWQNHAPLPPENLPAIADATREQHRKFRRTIFWRDVREVGIGAVLIPIWFLLGRWQKASWVWYLMIPALLFIIAFMLIGRWRHRQDRPSPGDSLHEALDKSLREVQYQIWLLRHVGWWYLGPLLLALVLIDLDKLQRAQQSVGEFWGSQLFGIALFAFIWWLNQTAIRRSLEPRRSELQSMLDQLR